MQFNLTEEHVMIRKAAKDFAVNECLPGVIERDEHQKFPYEQVKKLAELGFMGMMVEEKYGGAGLDTVSYVLAMEEISKVDASVSVCMSVNNSLVCWGLEAYGSENQKEKYLKPLAQGIKNGELYIGAFLLSEPEAGSDASSQRTTAEDRGDHYIINGTKNWITNGSTASVYLVMAQTDASKGSKGINAFIVEKKLAWCFSREQRKQAGYPRQRHPQHYVPGRQSAQGKPYWRRWLRLHLCHENPGRRTHRHCLPGTGHSQWVL